METIKYAEVYLHAYDYDNLEQSHSPRRISNPDETHAIKTKPSQGPVSSGIFNV